MFLPRQRQGAFAAGGQHHAEAALLQSRLQQITRIAIIVDHQHLARPLQHPIDRGHQPARLDRLGQIIDRAHAQAFLLIAHHRDNDHRDVRRQRIVLQLLQQFKAIGVRQINIERDQIGFVARAFSKASLARPAMLT